MSIDFSVGFQGLDAAIAQWRNYQASLESTINASNQVATTQQNLARTVAGMGQSIQGAGQAFTQYGASLQQAASSQTQFAQAQQQSISILSGAGTTVEGTAQSYTTLTGAMANVGTELDSVNKGLNEHNTLQENLAGSTATSFEKVQQLGSAFGMAAGSITGLVFSAHSLNRATVMLHRTETMLLAAENKLEDQHTKLGKAVLKYGQDSQEVAAIQADMAVQAQKIGVMQERASLVQESYNMQLVSFAATTGPLVISTFSSVTQGITQMGEILNISRSQVTNFISSWGPWMAAGAVVVAVATDVISVMTQINKLEEQRQKAVTAGDPFGKLTAELKELETFNADPLFKIGDAIFNIMGGPAGKAASKEFHLELDLRKFQQGILTQIDDFVQDPEFANAWNGLPEVLKQGLQGQLDTLVGIPFNPVNYLNPETGQVDPAFMSKTTEIVTKQLIPALKAGLQAAQAEAKRITLSGTEQERAAMMGLPTSAQMQEEQALYKGNLTSALVLLKDFNTRRLSDATLTWDRYLSAFKTQLPQWFTDMAKSMVNLQSTFTSQGGFTQGSANWFKNLQGGMQEVTDAEKVLLPTSDAVNAILGEMNNTATATGASLTITAEDTQTAAEALKGLIEGHRQQIEMDKAVNAGMRQQVETWAGPLPQAMQFTTEQLTAANDEYMRTGSVTKGVNVLLEENKKQFDQLRASLGDVDTQIQDVVNATDLMTGSQEAASISIAKWYDGLTKGIALEDQQVLKLTEMAESFGIDLPAGIQLTSKELFALIESYKKTGSAAGAMAEIHNQVFSEMHSQITELVDAAVTGGKEWSKAWKEFQGGVPKGQKGFFKDFFGDLGDFQEAESVLNTTGAALDAFLDITGGQMDTEMMDDFSKKFVKDIKDLREEAADLPYTTGNLDGLLASVQAFAKSADSPEDFRIINGFITDLNTAMKDGLTADEIQALTDKWGGFFGAFAGNPEQDIIKVDTALGNLINTAGSSALEDYLTEGKNVAPTIDMTATITALDTTGLTENKINNTVAAVTALDQTGLTDNTLDTVGSVVSLDQTALTDNTIDVVANIVGTTTGAGDGGGGGGGEMWVDDNGILHQGGKPQGQTVQQKDVSFLSLPPPPSIAITGGGIVAGDAASKGVNSIIPQPKPYTWDDWNAFVKSVGDFLGNPNWGKEQMAKVTGTAQAITSWSNQQIAGITGPLGQQNLQQLGQQTLLANMKPPEPTIPQVQQQNIADAGAQFAPMITAAAAASKGIQTEFSSMFTALQGIFMGVAEAWSLDMNSLGANTASGSQQVQTEISNMFTASIGILGGIATFWSEQMNSFGANAASASVQVQTEFSNMYTALTGIFEAIAGSFTDSFAAGFIIPAPNTEEFANAMNTLLLIPEDFMKRWNDAFVGGKKGESGLTIPAPNVEDFTNAMNTLLLIPANFIDQWNEAFGGGGGKKKKKGGASGLTIPAPNVDVFTEAMNTLLLIPEDFITRWNDAFGGGGGKKKKKGGSGLTIPPPDTTQFVDAMNTLLLIPEDFITRWNEAFGTGGGKKKKKKGGGGLVIPAPDQTLFEAGLNSALELVTTFVEDFTTGMEDSVSAAEDAGDSIGQVFDDIIGVAEDATSAIEDVASALDDLDGTTANVTVNVGLTGAGVKYLQHGYHGVVNKPTLMIVGEAGPERVDVGPSGGAAATGLMADRNINIIPEITASNKSRVMQSDKPIIDLISAQGQNRDMVASRIMRHLTIPIQVKIGQRTIIDIIKEHLLDEY